MSKTAMFQEKQRSGRVNRLKREWHETPPRLSMEWLRFMKDTYRENATEPPTMVRARLLENVLANLTIFIDANPIVGSTVEHRRGAIPHPEWSCGWSKENTHSHTHIDELFIADEDLPLLEEAVAFWRGRCTEDKTNALFEQMHPDAPSCAQLGQCGVLLLVTTPIIQTVVNWKKVLTLGLTGIIREAEDNLRLLPVGDSVSRNKRNFLRAAIITLRATIAFAHRYSGLASDLAAKEMNSQRKTELEKIADTCRWVPENPPRTFYEAIQSWWFVFVVNWMESDTGTGMGRITDDFYPFYAEDKKKGRITQEQAIELLQLLFLKVSECGKAIFTGQ